MKIHDVIFNLERTIAGKEWYLSTKTDSTVRQILTMNIDELKRILADLRQCS